MLLKDIFIAKTLEKDIKVLYAIAGSMEILDLICETEINDNIIIFLHDWTTFFVRTSRKNTMTFLRISIKKSSIIEKNQ